MTLPTSKYRVLISDFDHTLAREDDGIGDFTRETLNTFIRAGGLFVVASGRVYGGNSSRVPDLGLPEGYDLPIVSCQGAAAQTYLSQKELHRAEIPKDTAVALLKRTAALGLYTQLYINGVIRAAGDNEFLRYYTAKMRGAPYELVGELVAFMQKSEALPEKILCVVDKSLARGIVETLSREFAGRVKVVSSIPVFVESVSINAGKDMAIESVLKAYGYTLQDAVICGDNYNDIDMVRRAGLGVAVANAEPALKAVARYVTESNDQEGVAHAARKFCIGF